MSSPSATATWDRQAARYGTQERLETKALATAVRLASCRPDERLVDLGTGTGALLRRLAAAPVRPASAIGVDSSAAMLARAGHLPEGCSTLAADARAVPLADGSANVVTCAYLLHLLDPAERAAVLTEARRLLRGGPGARLVTVTVWADPRRPASRALGAALRLMARAFPERLGGLMPLDPTRDLEAAGFAVTRRVLLPRGGYPSLVLRASR